MWCSFFILKQKKLIIFFLFSLQRQASGATTGNSKPSAGQGILSSSCLKSTTMQKYNGEYYWCAALTEARVVAYSFFITYSYRTERGFCPFVGMESLIFSYHHDCFTYITIKIVLPISWLHSSRDPFYITSVQSLDDRNSVKYNTKPLKSQ